MRFYCIGQWCDILFHCSGNKNQLWSLGIIIVTHYPSQSMFSKLTFLGTTTTTLRGERVYDFTAIWSCLLLCIVLYVDRKHLLTAAGRSCIVPLVGASAYVRRIGRSIYPEMRNASRFQGHIGRFISQHNSQSLKITVSCSSPNVTRRGG